MVLPSNTAGVGQLTSAVSTTMLNLASEDTDLAEFGDGDFASDLRGHLDQVRGRDGVTMVTMVTMVTVRFKLEVLGILERQ